MPPIDVMLVVIPDMAVDGLTENVISSPVDPDSFPTCWSMDTSLSFGNMKCIIFSLG